MIYGDVPTQFSFLVSCDSKYLHNHFKPFAISAALSKNNVHLHIINPTADDWSYITNLRRSLANVFHSNITVSAEDIDLTEYHAEAKRTYYACNRFIVAYELMELGSESLMISDIDSLIMEHVEQPKGKLGLYLRDPLPGTIGWEQEGSRVAAGLVYYHKDMKPFAKDVAHFILHNPLQWFLDQMALNQIYQKYKEELTSDFVLFDSNLMDWEFLQGSKIWTGKGNRKYENITYVNKKMEFDNLIKLEE